MKCPECKSYSGTYSEIEDFNPGGDPEWSYWTYWQCDDCVYRMNQYEEGFEYEN